MMKLTRWEKSLIHFGLLGIVGASLFIDGAKAADWSFLVLSLLLEIGA